MDRLVEMNKNVEDLGDVNNQKIPTFTFIDGGKKIRIEFAFKSDDLPTDPPNPNHPKRDSHRVLRETAGNLYAGDLSVSVFGLSGQGALIQVSAKVKSKAPGGGGISVP